MLLACEALSSRGFAQIKEKCAFLLKKAQEITDDSLSFDRTASVPAAAILSSVMLLPNGCRYIQQMGPSAREVEFGQCLCMELLE
jgi:hypothetical protein